MKDVVIVGGVRTAVGAFGGALKNTPVVDLGALVIHDALKRLNLKPVAGPEVPEFAPDALAESRSGFGRPRACVARILCPA